MWVFAECYRYDLDYYYPESFVLFANASPETNLWFSIRCGYAIPSVH